MNVKIILYLIGVLVFSGLVAGAMHIKHQADKVPGLEASLRTTQAALEGEKKAFQQSEQLRKDEHAQAVQALNKASTACEARVAEARRSSAKIRKLLDAPVKYDKNHCPVRTLLNPDQLRDALGSGR